MKTLYGFKKYSFPKKAMFSVTTSEYNIQTGWIEKQVECIIIGETHDCYISKLIQSEHGIWVSKRVKKCEYILPIGYHKSRLIKWVNNQLQLF